MRCRWERPWAVFYYILGMYDGKFVPGLRDWDDDEGSVSIWPDFFGVAEGGSGYGD